MAPKKAAAKAQGKKKADAKDASKGGDDWHDAETAVNEKYHWGKLLLSNIE